jgi:N-acetylglutamate synthase-like GNAT family acetyltransferase
MEIMRPKNPAERRQVSDIVNPLFEAAFHQTSEPYFWQSYKTIVLIREGDDVIAAAALEHLDGNKFRTRFEAVHPDHRRKGHGKALFRAMEECAAWEDAKGVIFSFVDEYMIHEHEPFMTSMGFKRMTDEELDEAGIEWDYNEIVFHKLIGFPTPIM